jgi:hypothetical protein
MSQPTPSPDLRSARDTLQAVREHPDARAILTPATQVADWIDTELPGADHAQLGWGLLGLAVQLANSAETYARAAPFVVPHTAFLDGAASYSLFACLAGDILIGRDESSGHIGALSVPDALAAGRAGLVRKADATVRQANAVPSVAEDLRLEAYGQGRWAGNGMVDRLAAELSGMDRQHVGWGLVMAGTRLSYLANVGVGEIARHRFRRKLKKLDDAAPFLGGDLIAALLILAGDACIGVADQ